jgi:hyperosmotically inducible protein
MPDMIYTIFRVFEIFLFSKGMFMKNVYKILCSFAAFSLLTMSTTAFADNNNADSLKSTVNDSVITAKIKSQLVANDDTKAASIKVETNNGIVKLTGVVDSEREAVAAIQTSESTVGVKGVDTDNLNIKNNASESKQPVQDSYITAKVKGALLREKFGNDENFSVSQITVETQNGVVYLSGEAANKGQIHKVIEVAKSITGVHKVVSKLTVKD